MSLKVLAFMAHPDDAEFSCMGTMIRLKQEAGCQLAIATAASGDCGTTQYPPDEIARIRNQEARNAAALVDAEYYAAGCKDLLICCDAPTMLRFTEIIRRVKPDIVFTHPPMDYMTDHENTGRVVRNACFGAGAPNLLTYDPCPAPPFPKIPHLYYVDVPDNTDIYGQPIPADFVVDITDVMPLKEKMLACHVSQREWLRAHHNMDEYVESMKRRGAQRGKEINRPYGEGFRQYKGHAYPQNNIIAELLKL
ncbi:MAG TPA: PIG-L family deacetylase [Phycisphaerae bacterium]|jgi:LmbE family N-acetylglucosaminyl deacetylase|nr:PIG-L family deacetylase [Phycisphaerae bacterium]HOB74459.1 PIG-L family deacetylase [Phycisphaerae bacterium]HOJ54287.1 PIG-L family deacetylase [Phycisphaerae bacterium]HOL26758.1 PIG-L family deacetylase [Phycisphaerae bacterium]HPP20644.1 PIG-L family deacetylase [Phycisphaerae bacterium]